MIEKAKIESFVEEKLADTNMFLVNVSVGKDNEIEIIIDSDTNVDIDSCVEISRYVESKLDREKEDFSIDVMSAGLCYPLELPRQYQKNIGKNVEVITKEGKKLKGELQSFDDDKVVLSIETMEKAEGEKRKKKVIRSQEILKETIVSTKLVIDFK